MVCRAVKRSKTSAEQNLIVGLDGDGINRSTTCAYSRIEAGIQNSRLCQSRDSALGHAIKTGEGPAENITRNVGLVSDRRRYKHLRGRINGVLRPSARIKIFIQRAI